MDATTEGEQSHKRNPRLEREGGTQGNWTVRAKSIFFINMGEFINDFCILRLVHAEV